MRKIFSLAAVFFFVTQAYAIRESNGGKGVMIEDQVILWDLYHAGISEPYIKSASVSIGTRAGLTKLPAELPRNEIGRKVDDIGRISQKITSKMFAGLKNVQWIFTDQVLAPTRDLCMEDDGPNTVQIARRTQAVVIVNRQLWNKMSRDQQAALIIHELVYFAADPRSMNLNACKVNDFVATVYSRKTLEIAQSERPPRWLELFGIYNNR